MPKLKSNQQPEKTMIRSPDTGVLDQRSPARLAARKSLHMAIATVNHYNTPCRGARLSEFEFTIHLLSCFLK
jgi:hypothetical protein